MAIALVERGLFTGHVKKTTILPKNHTEDLRSVGFNPRIDRTLIVKDAHTIEIHGYSEQGLQDTHDMDSFTGEEINQAKIKGKRTTLFRRKPIYKHLLPPRMGMEN